MATENLRIPSVQRRNQIFFFVNGQKCRAYEGETVFAALYALGYKVMNKRYRIQDAHSGFCSMGICYECLVSIDGRKNQRACMVEVGENMKVIIDAC